MIAKLRATRGAGFDLAQPSQDRISFVQEKYKIYQPIDLSKVKWMNSSGLGALMASLTTLRNAGGDLKLANVTKKIESLLLITKLITVFETYESVDRAVASFLK